MSVADQTRHFYGFIYAQVKHQPLSRWWVIIFLEYSNYQQTKKLPYLNSFSKKLTLRTNIYKKRKQRKEVSPRLYCGTWRALSLFASMFKNNVAMSRPNYKLSFFWTTEAQVPMKTSKKQLWRKQIIIFVNKLACELSLHLRSVSEN
jgi:hypothetical protein